MRWLPISPFVILFLAHLQPSSADTNDDTRVILRTGATGAWTIQGEPPSTHHRVECRPPTSGTVQFNDEGCQGDGPGNFSFDYYSGEGEAVKFSAYSQGGKLTAQVWAIRPTCNGGPEYGYTVFVDLHVDGSLEGWVSYGHLGNVSVEPGQWIGSGKTIGYQKWWKPNRDNCWVVSTPEGVHTHVEAWDRNASACYVDHGGPHGILPETAPFGVVGRTIYQPVRSKNDAAPACIEVPRFECVNYRTSAFNPPMRFGAAYNVFSDGKELVVEVRCDEGDAELTVGSGSNLQVIYEKGYISRQGSWAPIELRGAVKDGVWLRGWASAELDFQALADGENHVVAYICTFENGAWLCGCSDVECREPAWQLQSFVQP